MGDVSIVISRYENSYLLKNVIKQTLHIGDHDLLKCDKCI